MSFFPIDILLMAMRSKEIVWHLGHYPRLNTNRDQPVVLHETAPPPPRIHSLDPGGLFLAPPPLTI